MLKSTFAVITAVLVWVVVATIGNLLLRAAMPGYSEVEAAMNFTVPMLVARLALGLVSSLCAGAACAGVAARHSLAVPVAAGVHLVLFLPVHYTLWSKFPLWYHLFFLVTLVPAILLGAALYRRIGPAPRMV